MSLPPRLPYERGDQPAGPLAVVLDPARQGPKKRATGFSSGGPFHQAEVVGLLQELPPLTGPPDADGFSLVARTLRATAAAGGTVPVQNAAMDANHCASGAIR